MKTSTEIVSASKICGEEKAVELIAKAGFDAWDFSMFDMCRYSWDTHSAIFTTHPLSGNNYLSFARKLKKIGEDNGIHCNQSHAPFPADCKEIRSFFKRAIECTAEAGGKICIIHPANDSTPQENAEMYSELLPFAKEHGIKIAAENMWNWDNEKGCSCAAACSSAENFKEHLDAVNDDCLVACLDIGHAEMKGAGGGAVKMIKTLGSKLQALHLHDNDLLHDSHQIPFSMSIDFNAVVKALKKINYSGYFTLEADRYLSAFNEDTVLEGLKNMAAADKRLVKMFEE